VDSTLWRTVLGARNQHYKREMFMQSHCGSHNRARATAAEERREHPLADTLIISRGRHARAGQARKPQASAPGSRRVAPAAPPIRSCARSLDRRDGPRFSIVGCASNAHARATAHPSQRVGPQRGFSGSLIDLTVTIWRTRFSSLAYSMRASLPSFGLTFLYTWSRSILRTPSGICTPFLRIRL